MARITVLGAGGWGTALAVTMHRFGHRVTLWTPFTEEAESIRQHGEHKKLLLGVPVSPDITLSTDIACVNDAELIILAVPSVATVQTVQNMAPFVRGGTIVVNVGKGLEKHTHRRFSEVMEQCLPQAQIAVLSGPSHAEEVGRGVPTAVVCASKDMIVASAVQQIMMNPVLRIYVTTDVIGVELGGAFKNVIALAAGICDGMDVGDNTKAALMTRGLAEITRLGVAMGAKAETFIGLSGMGDLIVTCGSMHSRNRRAGILIGQGMSPEEAVAHVGTVEGYFAALEAHEMSQAWGVEMPISEMCYRICYQNESVQGCIRQLMERPGKSEIG